MGLSHEASAARLLTEQDRPRGHQGLGCCVNPQMVTEGPISRYPVTKEVPLLPPTFSSLVLPPRPTSVPPLLSGKGRENRRCWDCIIASITVIIYTSILSYSLFFRPPLQSISPGALCAAETRKRSAGSYFRNDKFFFPQSVIFFFGGTGGGKKGQKLH